MASSLLPPSFVSVVNVFRSEYLKTPLRLRVIDAFMAFMVATGVIQFVYMALVGTFPFNSFLAGFLSCVGSFVITAGLRMQVNPENKDFKDVTPERAFADYCVAMLLLHLVVINFIG